MLESRPIAAADEPGTRVPRIPHAAGAALPTDVRRLPARAGCTDDLGDPRLTAILQAVRQDPKLPLTLRCNVDTVYRYQNPGHAEDTAEGELFNAKRDLDIVQKLGLVPGDTRPAIDMFERVLAKIPQARGICGYETQHVRHVARLLAGRQRQLREGPRAGDQGPHPAARLRRKRRSTKKTSAAAIYQAPALQIRPHHLLCMSCFHGGKDKLAPIAEDNLFEAIDVIQKQPDIPVTLIAGVCMICPPCGKYDPANKLCVGGRSMALRDQKKDLDVLQKLGLKYGDTLPARKLYQLLFERIPSTRDICGYGDGETRATEWSICGERREGRRLSEGPRGTVGNQGLIGRGFNR